MNAKPLAAAGILLLAIVWLARADPPTPPSRDQKPIRAAEAPSLAPGTYLSVPYTLIVVVPPMVDSGIAIGLGSRQRFDRQTLPPPNQLIPLPRQAAPRQPFP